MIGKERSGDDDDAEWGTHRRGQTAARGDAENRRDGPVEDKRQADQNRDQ